MIKYCVFNRQGKRTVKSNTTRKRLHSRVNYPAIIGFRRTKDEKYVVFKFVEGHNHGFASPTNRLHMKSSSDMHIGKKRFIFNNLKLTQGPTCSFRMGKEQVDSYMRIGSSLDDFKNFYRDLKGFILMMLMVKCLLK